MASEISIYAELLQNIRQVTVAIALPSPTNAFTTVTVAEDGSAVSISHDGLSAQLRLPAIVDASAYGGFLPVLPVTCSLSWRLPLAMSLQQRRPEGQAAVPWPATNLRPGGEVSCRACGGVVVGAGRIAEWKDLPSENWAEMMEFWHCHKPGDGHGHGHGHGHENHTHNDQQGGGGKADETTLASRGYGANSIISAQEGIGFVDLTSLWFAEKDCEGILFSIASGDSSKSRTDLMYEEVDGVSRAIHLSCAICEAQLGYFNDRTSAVTLFKWKVSCTTKSITFPPFSPPRQPTAIECLAATLLATTARTGSSKALLIPTLERSKNAAPNLPARVLHLWTLNPAIHYVSTLLPDEKAPIPAMKLFYETIDRRAADRMLERVAVDVEEVAFPADAIAEVAAALDAANALLPFNDKAFREWQVGLLRRWEVE